jgi:6-phospho-beta-glucosidase
MGEDKMFYLVNHHINLAHARTVLRFKEMVPQGKIGASFAYGPGYAMDCRPQNELACQNYDELENYWWLDVYCYGEYPHAGERYLEKKGLMPAVTSQERELLKKAAVKMDFIGINYYHTNVCTENAEGSAQPYARINTSGKKGSGEISGLAGMYKNPPNPYLETTDWDWAIDPDGLRYACREITSRYRRPIVISENGMGAFDKLEDGCIHDQYRIDYLREHVRAVEQAVDDGCDILSYCIWSFTDLLSWLNGYQKRYGLVYVDRGEEEGASLKRYRKDSFYWYKRVIESDGREI